MIRPAKPDDIPVLVDLHLRTFGTYPGRPPDLDYRTIFFDHPWYDPEFPPLVCQRDGAIVGFVGFVVRPMELGNRRLRMGVPSRFMVEETEGKVLISVALVNAIRKLPVDFIFGDKANEAFRRFLLRAGGETVVPTSLHWNRSFTPADQARQRLGRRKDMIGLAGRLARPLSALADQGLTRMGWNDFSAAKGYQVKSTLEPEPLLRSFEEFQPMDTMRPVVTPEEFRWLLGSVERMGRERSLHGGIVLSPTGTRAGAFLYYLSPTGKAEVLKFACHPSQAEAVFVALLRDTRGRGATFATGRAGRALVPLLGAHRCTLSLGNPWSLLLTRDPEVRAAVHGAAASLSRVEAEWY